MAQRQRPAPVCTQVTMAAHKDLPALEYNCPDGLKDLRLPKDAGELKVLRNGRLAPFFSVYEESERGRIDDNGRRLRRTVYRWNGRFYSAN